MFDFGFGTKRHMVEPLAVSHIVYKFRKIKLMARVQYGECSLVVKPVQAVRQ